MRGVDPTTNKPISPFEIPLTPRDVHVPWRGMTIERRDLAAAAKLLSVIHQNVSRFDFEMFQGALWDSKTAQLFLPLPGWGLDDERNDLTGLKPIIEAWPLQFVRKFSLVLIDSRGHSPDVRQTAQKRLQAIVSSLMPLTGLASAGRISWVDLESLGSS